MTKQYFYVDSSWDNSSSLSKIAEQLVRESRKKYTKNIYSWQRLEGIVKELKARGNEIQREHPRWTKFPEIKLSRNNYTGDAWLRIDKWSFICRRVNEINLEDDAQCS